MQDIPVFLYDASAQAHARDEAIAEVYSIWAQLCGKGTSPDAKFVDRVNKITAATGRGKEHELAPTDKQFAAENSELLHELRRARTVAGTSADVINTVTRKITALDVMEAATTGMRVVRGFKP